jgi:hypothetical protein
MASRLFPLIRPAYEEEPKLDLATAEAKNSNALSADLRRQITFDDQVVNELRRLALDDARIEALENSLVNFIATVPSPPSSTNPGSPTAPAPSKPATPQTPTTAGSNPAGLLAVPGSGATPDPSPQPSTPKETIPPPAGEPSVSEEKEEEEEEDAPRARPITIFLAVGVCFIAALCVIGYIVWDQMNSFKGADQISELLNSTTGLTGDEFEAVQTTTDSLKDWFLLKNEHFAVPKEFGPTKTIASRVVPFRNASVGEVMAKDDRELLYFLFDPADLGVKLQQGKWEIVEGERLVGAVTTVESTCFVVAFPGKRDAMETYLAKKGLTSKR